MKTPLCKSVPQTEGNVLINKLLSRPFNVYNIASAQVFINLPYSSLIVVMLKTLMYITCGLLCTLVCSSNLQSQLRDLSAPWDVGCTFKHFWFHYTWPANERGDTLNTHGVHVWERGCDIQIPSQWCSQVSWNWPAWWTAASKYEVIEECFPEWAGSWLLLLSGE